MNTEIQPLISGSSPSVKRAGVHKGWFVLAAIVVGIFCIAAVFHQQIGNIFGVKKYVICIFLFCMDVCVIGKENTTSKC